MSKVMSVLISHIPIPSVKNGSWNKMLEYFFLDYDGAKVDCLIDVLNGDEITNGQFPCEKHSIYEANIFERKFLRKDKYYKIIRVIRRLLDENDYLILGVVDNIKMLTLLSRELSADERSRCKIIFFIHGFSYHFSNRDALSFFSKMDHIVYLTIDSYLAEKQRYHSISCEVSILHNGIDNQRFMIPSSFEKEKVRRKLGWQSEGYVFIWVSHDRPKKGLFLLLNLWPKILEKYPNSTLKVIGASRDFDIKGVTFYGKVPNSELPEFYMASDIFLFTTLCEEGYPLSLSEAINCGLFPIGSDLGGVAETMNGNGILIKYPHFESDWLKGVSQAIEILDKNNNVNPYLSQVKEGVYTINHWCYDFNHIFEQWKKRLS